MIHPSPALTVRADSSIEECVRLMRRHGVGSVLVVTDDSKAKLIGIFTERDLLKKIDLIQHGGYWRRPIRTVMTRPVRTIALADLDAAAELMIENGFRHLPVVSSEVPAKAHLLGVISMRDLLTHCVRDHSPEKMPAPRPAAAMKIGVVTMDASFLILMKRIVGLRVLPDPGAVFARSGAALRELKTLVIDIDGLPPLEWSPMLRKLNREGTLPLTVIAFDPARHSPQSLKILEQLGRSKRFAVFAKPVNVFALLQRLKSGTI